MTDFTTHSKQQSKVLCGLGENRTPIISVLVKCSYQFSKESTNLHQLEQVAPIQNHDSYNGIANPSINSIYKANESIPYKRYTDLALIGVIRTYQDKEVHQLDVGVDVESKKKIIRIFGDRFCIYQRNNPPKYSETIPFSKMPIEYEKAYGGKDTISILGETYSYPRNPIGTGYALFNKHELIDKLKLPNFEDPNDLLLPNKIITGKPHNWNNLPLPQGFGWMSQNTYPRSSFSGIIPAYISANDIPREAQLGVVPKNQISLARQLKLPSYDAQINNGATIGMSYSYLKPNTKIKLANIFKDTKLMEFKLPKIKPKVYLDIGEGKEKINSELQTVAIDIDTYTVELIWQAWKPLSDFYAFSQLNTIDYDVS